MSTVAVPGPRPLPRREGVGLVDIVSGSFGAGHDAAAREIAVLLGERGFTTRTSDIVDLMPGRVGRALRAGYLRQVQSLPASWSWTLRVLERHPAATHAVAAGLGSAGPGLLALAADRPRLVVSTHPFASQALGGLRAAGRLDVPVATYLTDMSVHPLWVHAGVDLHLALHDVPAGQARRHGAGATTVVRPAVPARFAAGAASVRTGGPLAVRRSLGLPMDEPLALVTGGSCGIGDLERSALEVAATGPAVPVVLCGHNEALRRRVAQGGHAVALGWVDDVPALLSAVDAVVQNAGGSTSLETLAAGVPVLSYRCIAGHGESNAAALAATGLVPWARSRAELSTCLEAALVAGRRGGAPAAWAAHPDVAEALAGLLGDVVTAPAGALVPA